MTRDKILGVILWWDFLAAIALSLFTAWCLPEWIPSEFAYQMFSISITVLAVIFSVFFAILAVIIAANDNAFVEFLEMDGFYSELTANFGFTLGSLFVALVYAFVACVCTSYELSLKLNLQNKWAFVIFLFLLSYSLLATVFAIRDCLKYAKNRIEFAQLSKTKQ